MNEQEKINTEIDLEIQEIKKYIEYIKEIRGNLQDKLTEKWGNCLPSFSMSPQSPFSIPHASNFGKELYEIRCSLDWERTMLSGVLWVLKEHLK